MSKKAKEAEPVGWAEIFSFDPKTGTGHIYIITIDKDDRPLEVTREFFEGGGQIEWDGDPDAVALIDRYIEHRKKVLAGYPAGYPIPGVGLVRSGASNVYGQRLRRERAEALSAWLEENAEALSQIKDEAHE